MFKLDGKTLYMSMMFSSYTTHESYVGCEVRSATAIRRTPLSRSGSFNFICNFVGTRFFSCGVGDACNAGKQRVRVHGIDSRKTQDIRNSGGHSLAEYMKLSVESYTTTETIIPEDRAQLLENMLVNSKPFSESCSDWLVATQLNNHTCMAFVYTDLGVLYHRRESSNLVKSAIYTDQR